MVDDHRRGHRDDRHRDDHLDRHRDRHHHHPGRHRLRERFDEDRHPLADDGNRRQDALHPVRRCYHQGSRVRPDDRHDQAEAEWPCQ